MVKYERNDEGICEHKFNYMLDPKYDIYTTNTKSEQIKKNEISLNDKITDSRKANNTLTTDLLSISDDDSTMTNDYSPLKKITD